MRRCIYCGKEKEDEFFIHDKYAKGGIKNVCLECNKKRAKMRRAISKKHLEELEKKLNDYIQITSISIDMSKEEAPYNRIFAKPIEKQGDVLLCEFESANYDIEQKALKEENTKLKTENKWYSEQLNEAVKEVGHLKELLTMVRDEIGYLRKHYKGNIDHLKNNTRLDKKINQVLGEE